MKLWVPIINIRFKPVAIGGTKKPAKSNHSKLHTSAKPAVRFNSKLWLAGGMALTLLISGLILSWRAISGPNYGQVAKFSQDTTPTTALPKYTTLATNFYSLNYPENYKQDATDITPAGIIDQKKLSSPDGSTKAEITIKAAPYGGITQDSSYDYYVKHTNRYKIASQYYHGEAIDIASSISNPAEAVGLWLHNDFILSIKLTSDGSQAALNQQLKDMLSSVQFQQ